MLDRLSTTIASLTVATAVADSEEVNFGGYAGGTVFIPSGATTALLTYYAAEKPGGTYLALYDKEVAAVTQVVSAAKAYQLPEAVFGCRAIKIVGDVAVTAAISLKG